MKSSKFLLVAAVVMAVAGCAAKTLIAPKQYSGFLSDYSGLKEVRFVDGRTTQRWVSSSLTRSKYSNVYIEPIAVYPEPRAHQQVDPKLLSEAARYLGLKIRHQLRGGSIKVVEKQAPDTVRIRAAITTVEESKSKTNDIPSMTLLVGGPDAIAADRKRDIDVYLEVEMTDMKTGDVLARSVKKGLSSKTLQNSKQVISFEDVRPLLDLWAVDAQNFAERCVGRSRTGFRNSGIDALRSP